MNNKFVIASKQSWKGSHSKKALRVESKPMTWNVAVRKLRSIKSKKDSWDKLVIVPVKHELIRRRR